MRAFELEWAATDTPAAACARAMEQRRPFIITCDREVSIGDLVMIDGFSECWEALRFPAVNELPAICLPHAFVAQEPPIMAEPGAELVGELVSA